jgi:hypothetical protein
VEAAAGWCGVGCRCLQQASRSQQLAAKCNTNTSNSFGDCLLVNTVDKTAEDINKRVTLSNNTVFDSQLPVWNELTCKP